MDEEPWNGLDQHSWGAGLDQPDQWRRSLPGNTSFTNFYIQFLVDAMVSFNWVYATFDADPAFDPFGYELANTALGLDLGFAQLTVDGVALNQFGAKSVFVQAGQYFGFSTFSDNSFGAATTTINGLQIAEIPEPGTLLLLGLALAGAGSAARRRRAD